MRVAIFQANLEWESPKANCKKVEDLLKKISSDCDLLVVPEMFTTGFTTNPDNVAESMEGDSVRFMIDCSKRYDIAIMGSIIINENGHNYNRFIFTTPEGELQHYDKRHLFRMGGEDKKFSAGSSRKVFNYMGFNILPQVCYDLRFPVWSRNIDNQYDIAIYIASWPIPRVGVWEKLLQARAIENLCYVVGVNRVGKDPFVEYNGKSSITDYLGNTTAQFDDGEEGYLIYEFKREGLDKFRNKFAAHLDADKFTIKQ